MWAGNAGPPVLADTKLQFQCLWFSVVFTSTQRLLLCIHCRSLVIRKKNTRNAGRGDHRANKNNAPCWSGFIVLHYFGTEWSVARFAPMLAWEKSGDTFWSSSLQHCAVKGDSDTQADTQHPGKCNLSTSPAIHQPSPHYQLHDPEEQSKNGRRTNQIREKQPQCWQLSGSVTKDKTRHYCK